MSERERGSARPALAGLAPLALLVLGDGDAHLDVLPGVCPNTLDVTLEELLPPGQSRMSVLGNKFDVTQVELGTVLAGLETQLGLVGGPVVFPVNIDYVDTSTPLADGLPCECAVVGPDGILDLELTFSHAELVAVLGLNLEQDGSSVGLFVAGELNVGNGQREPFVARGDCVLVENPAQPVQSFCAGDSTATLCPCDNDGLPGFGCDNARLTGGVRLSVPVFDLGQQTASFHGQGFPIGFRPGVVLLRGNGRENAGQGTVFGDGLRCLTLPLRRLKSGNADNGTIDFAIVHGFGEGSFHYQLYYRSTPEAFCDPEAAFNLSNGVTIPW